MPDDRFDDRSWVEAVDRYVATSPPRAPQALRPGPLGARQRGGARADRLAVRDRRDRQRPAEGKRNPGSGSASRETEMISSDQDLRHPPVQHPRRQRRRRDLRMPLQPGREPCIRSNNLKNGRAFEFETDGDEAGRIETKTSRRRGRSRPTRRGVATGLNADRVDGFDRGRRSTSAPRSTPRATQVLNLGGLILSASCAAGPDLDVRAATTVAALDAARLAGTRTRATCRSTARTTTSTRARASRCWPATTTARRARSPTRLPRA